MTNPVLAIYLAVALLTFVGKLIELAQVPRYILKELAEAGEPPIFLVALITGLMWPILVIQKIIL